MEELDDRLDIIRHLDAIREDNYEQAGTKYLRCKRCNLKIPDRKGPIIEHEGQHFDD